MVLIPPDKIRELGNSVQERYPALRLEKEDLLQIGEIVHGVSPEVIITAGDRKLSNISEIDRIRRPLITDFQIKSKEPYIRLNLTGREARFYIKNATQGRMWDVAEQIDGILSKRKAWLVSLVSSVWFFLAFVALDILIYSFFGFREDITLAERRINRFLKGIPFLICVMGWFALHFRTRWKMHTVAYLVEPGDANYNLAKNKENIMVVGLIAAMILSIIINAFLHYQMG
ncbi:MAG: hypothetical protein ACYS8W_00630 [Planctomycetota bacterium]|jgi:hypothetical protein